MSDKLEELKKAGLAPEWYTQESYKTVQGGYLYKGENPIDMYKRVAKTAAIKINRPELEKDFFDIMFNKNWLNPASPVLSNLGTDRGLSISCYGVDVGDSVFEIYDSVKEMALLTKGGGGVGMSMSRIRTRGTPIKGGANGKSEGIVPWAKVVDSAILATSQGNVRRGAASLNLDIEHGDYEEFLPIRRPKGDINRQCLNLHQCSVISDSFMYKVKNGDSKARHKWIETLKSRLESGEPFIMFSDNVNKVNPVGYKNLNLNVSMTNICSEIVLYTDEQHSFICCLSSINLTKWHEWKNSNLVELATLFLNGVLNDFIEKGSKIPGFEKVVASAIKGRAIGIGALGWHSLLQQNSIAFDSFEAMMLNAEIFKHISDKAKETSKQLCQIYGEPEWCTGSGMYNSHLVAVAPTRSNSIISGDLSAGIEPIMANAYNDKTSKGIFIRKNKDLAILLEAHDKNNDDVWRSILINNGSVQHLHFLSDHEKEVFKTAYEINQMSLIKQAAQRQKYICQAQSLNLFFPADADPKWFSDVHMLAWESGVKTLYYCKSSSVIKGDVASRGDDCRSCEA